MKNRHGARLDYWWRLVVVVANMQNRKAERGRVVRGPSKRLVTGVAAYDMLQAVNTWLSMSKDETAIEKLCEGLRISVFRDSGLPDINRSSALSLTRSLCVS